MIFRFYTPSPLSDPDNGYPSKTIGAPSVPHRIGRLSAPPTDACAGVLLGTWLILLVAAPRGERNYAMESGSPGIGRTEAVYKSPKCP